MSSQYVILDGGRRWLAASLAGIGELDAIVLPSRPSPTELRLLQLSIDAHRVGLTPMERSDFLLRIKTENDWSIGQTAENLSMKQPLVTKLLKFQDGCKEIRTALHGGLIDQDKAYTICQEPDHARQRELLKHAGDLTREQIRQKARSKGQPVELRTTVARFPLPSGVTVSVQGRKITLAGAIDSLMTAVKELKKGQLENWDILTAARVLRHRAQTNK